MFENEQEKSKATLQAEENLRRAKQQPFKAKKKDNEKKRVLTVLNRLPAHVPSFHHSLKV